MVTATRTASSTPSRTGSASAIPPHRAWPRRASGTLTGGNLGTLTFASTKQTWGPTPPAPAADSITINATNIATASIDVTRAHVNCNVALNITTDGPLTVTLPGCNRTVTAG